MVGCYNRENNGIIWPHVNKFNNVSQSVIGSTRWLRLGLPYRPTADRDEADERLSTFYGHI